MNKVFLAISNHGDVLGGGEHSFIDLLSHLPPPWNPVTVVPERGDVAARIEQEDIALRVIPLPSIKPWNIYRIIKSIQSYARLCKKVNAQLVYANGSRAAFYGGLAGRILGIPVIWHCRIANRDLYLDTILCMLTSCIIANSHATAARFKPNFRHKIKTVYNGIDLQWLRDPSVQKADFIRKDWKVILIVARTSREKRHDLILSTFELLAKQDPNIHLICLGSRDAFDPLWWDFLQNRTLQSEAKERIHWVGHLKDVRPWYKGAHTLLFASENESFGRVVVEAMACGLPVIATRVGAIPEIIRNDQEGMLVPPGSAERMAEAVLKLLKDEGLRNNLSESGKRRAEEFNLEKHVKEMVQAFEETLKHHVRRVAR